MRRSLLLGMLMVCWLLPAASAAAADEDDHIVLVGSVLVDRDETAGDVVVVDGDVTIRGEVTGDVVVFDGDVTIRGSVAGNVVAFSGLATLGRRGRVAGDLVYGDDKPVLAPGAQVAGDVEKIDFSDASIVAAIGAWVAITVSLLVLGLLFFLLAPRAAESIARTGRTKALASAGVGLLAFFLIPAIAIALCVSLVGLPLGVVLLLCVVPIYALSYVAAALVFGRLILKKARLAAFIVGIVLLQALALIPIAGGIIAFLAIVFGLGVLLLTLLRARS